MKTRTIQNYVRESLKEDITPPKVDGKPINPYNKTNKDKNIQKDKETKTEK